MNPSSSEIARCRCHPEFHQREATSLRRAFHASSQAGFTILELIVVLVIVSLVAGLVIPAFSKTLVRMERQSAVREIASAFKYARNRSIAEKVPIAFQAQLSENQYWLEDLRTGEVSKVKSLPSVLVFRDFFDGDDTVTDETVSILFYPRGNTSGGTLRLSAPDVSDEQEWFAIEVNQVTGRSELIQSPYMEKKDDA